MDNKTQNIDLMSRFSCVVHSILKQWRILLLVACLFGSLVDVVRSLTYKPLYRASSVVALVNGDGKGLSSDDAIKAETSIQYLMDSVYLKEKVNATLKQDSFDGSVLFSLTANTNISTIYVQASSQKNAFFELKELINEYQKASKLSSFGYQLTSVEDITFTNMPINTNNHLQNYQKGFFMSLFVGIFILGFYSFIKDNIKTASDINDKLDVRLFAKVPKEIKKDQNGISLKIRKHRY